MTPQISQSEVTRPYVVSVEGDIPEGAQIVLKVIGTVPGGGEWTKTYVNPRREELATSQVIGFSFQLLPPKGSVAVPFLYAIVFEGDGTKRIYSAQTLAEVEAGPSDLVFMLPPSESRNWAMKNYQELNPTQPYLTRQLFPQTWVSRSEITRPWMLEVMGSVPDDAAIIVTMKLTEADGSVLVKSFHAPCREALASTSFVEFSYTAELRATSDGISTPFFHGLSIEGDERCFYSSASEMMEPKQVLPSRAVVRQAYRHFESPPVLSPGGYPSALIRLLEMHKLQELKPDASVAPLQVPLTHESNEVDYEDTAVAEEREEDRIDEEDIF